MCTDDVYLRFWNRVTYVIRTHVHILLFFSQIERVAMILKILYCVVHVEQFGVRSTFGQ